jgi:hypothetical protein
MNKELFLMIVQGVQEYNDYFIYMKDWTWLASLTYVQKCTTDLWCLAYWSPVDSADDYLRMVESTCFENVSIFCRVVIAVFASVYVKAPNEEDTSRIWHRMQQGIS